MDNPLEILGLQKDLADFLRQKGKLDEYLRKNYGLIQLQIHPDKDGDETLAKKINAAYDAIREHPENIASWIKQMGNGNGVSDECYAVIEGLTAKVEELQKVEQDYQRLREQYASVLASRAGSGERAEVRKAAPRAGWEEPVADDFAEDFTTGDTPKVKRPTARKVYAAAGETAARTEKPKAKPRLVEPIVLENLVLYEMDGRPAVTYKRLELDGEAVRSPGGEYLIKSQNECNEYFIALGDGRRLPALPELYAIMERLQETNHPVLEGIVTDLESDGLCTGTKIRYPKTIIHPGYGEINGLIPLGNHWLDEAVKNKPWKNALQALLMCKDAKKAVKALQDASGQRPYIWTPGDENRKSDSNKAVWLDVGTGGLGLSCDYDPILGGGRFRGVRCEP